MGLGVVSASTAPANSAGEGKTVRGLFLTTVLSGMLLKTADVTAHGRIDCRGLGVFSQQKMQCHLMDTDNMRVVCRIARLATPFYDIRREFTGLAAGDDIERAFHSMFEDCYWKTACRERFDCIFTVPTDGYGCHNDPFTTLYHCH